MQLSSCKIAETQLVKISQLWLKSEMDAVNERIYRFQIRNKCGNLWMHLSSRLVAEIVSEKTLL